MKDEKKKKISFPWYRVAYLLLGAVFITSGVVYASFRTSGTSVSEARVAKFVFDPSLKDGASIISLDALQQDVKDPGDKAEYQLLVTNKKSEAISEVAEQYTISILIRGNMPLHLTATKEGQPTPAADITKTTPEDMTAEVTGILNAGTVQNDLYHLVVEWPADQNDREFANGNAAAEITMKFDAVQID